MSDWQKPCPACAESIATHLPTCPHCDADVRERCETCGLPIVGEGELCHCGSSPEELEEAFSISPRSRRANRPDGGTGHGWLAMRRANVRY